MSIQASKISETLISIDQKICASHQDEKLHDEQVAVAKIKEFLWLVMCTWALAGGARGGTCPPPPPGNSKIWGPPKDNLTRKIFF